MINCLTSLPFIGETSREERLTQPRNGNASRTPDARNKGRLGTTSRPLPPSYHPSRLLTFSDLIPKIDVIITTFLVFVKFT